MQVKSMFFQREAAVKLKDKRLQKNLSKLVDHFVVGRTQAIDKLDKFEEIRAWSVARRNAVLEDLDIWIEKFEEEATKRGSTVLFAQTAEQARQLVVEIAKKHSCKSAIKSKSMVSEEIGLNAALIKSGVKVTETDLGEYILQINDNERPSHIIGPAVHKDKEEISELFARVHQKPAKTQIEELATEAREVLREKFMQADLGITGGNFLVAETGSVALLTNEGNEGMCTVVPQVHIAISGIEKVIGTFEELCNYIRLLARSATGQTIGNYFSIHTGVRRANERHGAAYSYIILLDAGRSSMLGGEFKDMLRCIRCGACMNHCPVFQKVGGHAYGWVYPGPMGSVLTPNLTGVATALDLPHAATLCGQCHVVCPMSIPLPDMLRNLREKQFERKLRPRQEVWALKTWAWFAMRPGWYQFATRLTVRLLALCSRDGYLIKLPWLKKWQNNRDFRAPKGRTFKELWAVRKG